MIPFSPNTWRVKSTFVMAISACLGSPFFENCIPRNLGYGLGQSYVHSIGDPILQWVQIAQSCIKHNWNIHRLDHPERLEYQYSNDSNLSQPLL